MLWGYNSVESNKMSLTDRERGGKECYGHPTYVRLVQTKNIKGNIF